MTIPTLIQKYQKKVVETHLARFYSIMSQAVLRYQTDANMLGESIVPPYSGKVMSADEAIEWFKNTIGPYIKTLSINKDERFCHNRSTCFTVKLADGSVFSGYVDGNVYIFYCVNPNKVCGFELFDGQNSFLFSIRSKFTTGLSHQNVSRDFLLESCKYGNADDSKKSSKNRRHACSALIQMDGWKIKDDYPWNQEFLKEGE